ncbi:MAG: CAP domain-containing protein, partial [Acidimicrobiia bacterium]|nr:CAP domain-containing protein [Acidimicrobiia bacterium]
PDQGATEPTSPPPTPTTEAPTPTSEAPAPPTTPTNPTPTTNPTPPTSPTPTTDPAEQTPASVADPEVTAAGLNEAEVASLAALSAERAKVGLAALRPDAQLSAYARGWAQEMRNSGFRHSSNQALLGLMSGTRSSVGENIAWHSDASMTPEQAAATFQEMWRNSPGHYANQVNTAWTEAGIGLYLDSSGWWAVHVFSNGTRAV